MIELGIRYRSRKGRAVRAIALLAAVTVLAAFPGALPGMETRAATVTDLQKQLQQLQKEEEQLKKQVKAQENSVKDQQAYKNSIDKQIANTKSQIDNLTNQIDSLNKQVSNKNSDIAAKEKEIAANETAIEDRFEQLRQRLRAISKSGNMTTLQMLLDADEYTDYLIKSKVMQRVAQNDQELLDSLEEELQQINAEKAALEDERKGLTDKKAQITALKTTADTKKKELDTLYAKANQALKKLQNDLNTYSKSLKQTEQEAAQLERQISQLINNTASTGKYGGGTMFWPVPAVHNLSSTFGVRWGRMHRGIDIANGSVPIYGQNVVAAADGVVISAFTANTWGGGYGYHLIIDHGIDAKGRKISTLYAHCSRINVKVGQKVVGGQTVVAQAGATGDVTGPHLHFEVRVNGTAVDPILNGYVKVN